MLAVAHQVSNMSRTLLTEIHAILTVDICDSITCIFLYISVRWQHLRDDPSWRISYHHPLMFSLPTRSRLRRTKSHLCRTKSHLRRNRSLFNHQRLQNQTDMTLR